jgi:ABC-type uncharacterized transport system substrate-binding protein
MKRRDLLLLFGAMLVPADISRAQEIKLLGFLHSGSPNESSAYWPAVASFHAGMREVGFNENMNLHIDYRWGEDQFDRLPPLAMELVEKNVQVLFAGGGDVAALAAKKATSKIPIVFAIGADPVSQGLVSSLSRPGGNVTGVTFLSVQLRPKMLELVQEIFPAAKAIGVLGNPKRPQFDRLLEEVTAPAEHMGLNTVVLQASSEQEIEAALSTLELYPVDALVVLSDPVYLNHRNKLAGLALSYGIPSIYPLSEHVFAGGLVSYGTSIRNAYKQAGIYCARILNGENPADMPILQPTAFELAINLKTAHALGITLPPSLVARADEVIE